jgi:AAA+ ATPase superfamily predicted ATPase
MFIGRLEELTILTELTKKSVASLVIFKGRRRIGKSSLAYQFAKTQKKFIQFQGLSPRFGQTNQDQLDHFAEQLSKQTSLPKLTFNTWTEAFDSLASCIQNERTLLLFDEISWMASHDGDFSGRLKIAWDNHFSKKSRLILIACGSVSPWIDHNILNSADFVGRMSAVIDLKELSLSESNQLLDPKNRLSTADKLKILAVTGGVPRYLEEIQYKQSADQNIKRLCFSPEGFLFSEFERIFNDIFDKRATKYRQIAKSLTKDHLTSSQICEQLKVDMNGVITGYLTDLEHSGFIVRSYHHQLGKSNSRKLSRYRLADNYLRFYLRYIEPEQSKIKSGLFRDVHLSSLPQWNSILGLQVESLVLANARLVIAALDIDPHHLSFVGPFFQTKNARNKGACQIDLLIETRRNLAYVCEVKFRQKITPQVIEDVQRKIEIMQKPKNFAVRPVLIYDGELADEDKFTEYFDALIPFESLLKSR